MTSLQETIQNFQDYVLEKNKLIEPEIVGVDTDFKDTRLSVYQEGYFLRLLEGLCRDFFAVEKLANEEFFDEIGRDYIRSFPSQHFSIRYIGQHFSKFLETYHSPATYPENTAENLQLMSEMAKFEWALENTTDAKDAHQLTFEEMSVIPPESWSGLKLTTHPSLQIESFHYAIPPLWQHLKQNREKPTLDRHADPTYWLIWRFNRQAYFRAMDANQFWMIQAIQSGKTFSEVCTGLCEFMAEEKVINFAAETLRAWISEGIFSEFNV